MPVVTNLSVLLSARVENYTSGIGFARKSNQDFKKSCDDAGLSTRSAAQALGILRKQAFDNLSVMDRQREEFRALDHLQRSGIITQKDYASALRQTSDAYRQLRVSQEAAQQKEINSQLKSGLDLVRPQLENQRKLREQYDKTRESLDKLRGSETARKLGISDAEILSARQGLTRNFIADSRGLERPDDRRANAAAAVDAFNERLFTARQKAKAQIDELRELKRQSEDSGRALNQSNLKARTSEILNQFRKDSGLDAQLAAQRKQRESAEAEIDAFNRRIFSAREQAKSQIAELRRLQQQAEEVGRPLDPSKVRGQANSILQKYRQDSGLDAQLAAQKKQRDQAKAEIDSFNKQTYSARERARSQIAELRRLQSQAQEVGTPLDPSKVRGQANAILEQYRRESGLDTRLAEQKRKREQAEAELQASIQRGLPLLDRKFVAEQRLLANQIDLANAAKAYPDLDVGAANKRLLDNHQSALAGRESLEQRQLRVKKENEAIEESSLNAFAKRAKAYQSLNRDIIAGLDERAAALRRTQIESDYRENLKQQNAPKAAIDQAFIDLQNKYNEAVKRGVSAAYPAIDANDRYRNSLKDLSKALNQTKITQDEFNRAKLAAKRRREDESLDPILRSGRDAADPGQVISTDVIRRIEDMRAAVAKGVISQKQMFASARTGSSVNQKLAQTYQHLRRALRDGTIGQNEFRLATQLAKQELQGQNSLIQRLTGSLGVLKTVGIGLAGAQLYGGIFGGLSDGFAFEKQSRLAIANFRDVDQETKSALREALFTSTEGNDTAILDRVTVLKELARDGISAATALGVFNDTLAFSSVTGLDAQTSVSRTSEVLKAYRLETGNAAQDSESLRQVMDLLFASSLQTASNVDEMSEALIRGAPQANQLGISLRSAAAGAIALSEIGRKGDVGGNELAIALRDITNKAIENREAFEELGIKVFDTDGDFVGISLTIRSLAEALEDMTAEDRVAALAKLDVTQKAAQFQQQLVSLVDVIENAETSFEQTNGAVKAVQGELPELNKLVNKLQSGFTYLINTTVYQFFESVAGAINSMNSQTRTAIVVGLSFAASFAVFISYAPTVIAWMVRIRAVLATLTAAQHAHNAAMIIAAALSGNWKQLAVGLVAAGAAAGIMYYLWKQMEVGFAGGGILRATEQLETLRDAINAGRDDIDGLQELFQQSSDAVTESLRAQADALEADDAKRAYLEQLTALMDGVSNAIQNADVAKLELAAGELEELTQSLAAFESSDSSNAKLLAQQFQTLELRTNRVKAALEGGAAALDNLNRSAGSGGTQDLSAAMDAAQKRLETASRFFGLQGAFETDQISGLLNRLNTDVGQLPARQFKDARDSLAKLQNELALSGSQSQAENRILGTYDTVIDRIREVYKTIGDESSNNFIEKQTRFAQELQSKLESPLDRAIGRLEQLQVLQVQLDPKIENDYIASVLKELDRQADSVGSGGLGGTQVNQEALIRSTAQEYSYRNAAITGTSNEVVERRRQHAELIKSLGQGNLTLSEILAQLRAEQNEDDADGVELFDGF